jgi:hypothetical protein
MADVFLSDSAMAFIAVITHSHHHTLFLCDPLTDHHKNNPTAIIIMGWGTFLKGGML